MIPRYSIPYIPGNIFYIIFTTAFHPIPTDSAKPYFMLLQPINLAIADDHTFFRKILKDFLCKQSPLNVTVEACDVLDLIKKLKLFPADIVVMDVFMPKIEGSEAFSIVRAEFPYVKVIALSMSTNLLL